MQRAEMEALIETHLDAEMRGDVAASVAVYTDDVVHDVVGAPTGPMHGKAGAEGFYNYLTANFRTEAMDPVRSWFGEDFCVVEHDCTGSVPGEFLGLQGHGRRVTFRMIHIWEFRDGLMSRENVWLDGAAITAQLSAPDLVGAPG